MLISTKGRYALRILIDMAEHQSDSYIPLKDVAARRLHPKCGGADAVPMAPCLVSFYK